MAWIESHQSLRNHRKVLTMVGLLGASKLEVIGSLHCLWWWAIDNAPDGLISERDVALLGQAAEWAGDGREYVQSLVASGFLEPTAAGYRLHDWDDYAGKLIDQRTANARRQKEHREREKARRAALELKAGPEPVTSLINNEERNGVVTVTSPLRKGATGPNPTGPDQPLSTNVDSGDESRNGVTNAVTNAESTGVTASHDAAASAALPPLSFLDRYVGRLETETKNRNGVLGAAYAELFGSCSRQQHGRLGALARDNGAVKTLKAAMKAAAEVDPRADDPLAYMAGILKSKNGATRESPYLTDEEHEEVRKRQAEFQRGYGVQV